LQNKRGDEMPSTVKMNIPYPAQGENPSWDSELAFINAIDAYFNQLFENTNTFVYFPVSSVSGSASNNTITLGGGIIIRTHATGFDIAVAGGTYTLRDGEALCVIMPRGITMTATVIPFNSNIAWVTEGALVLASRFGNYVQLKSGYVVSI
jgi:hypothetical protein